MPLTPTTRHSLSWLDTAPGKLENVDAVGDKLDIALQSKVEEGFNAKTLDTIADKLVTVLQSKQASAPEPKVKEVDIFDAKALDTIGDKLVDVLHSKRASAPEFKVKEADAMTGTVLEGKASNSSSSRQSLKHPPRVHQGPLRCQEAQDP